MVPSGLDAVEVILPLWVSCSHVGQYVKERERLGLQGCVAYSFSHACLLCLGPQMLIKFLGAP